MIKIFFVFLTILLFVTTDLQHSFFTNSSIKSIDIENDTDILNQQMANYRANQNGTFMLNALTKSDEQKQKDNIDFDNKFIDLATAKGYTPHKAIDKDGKARYAIEKDGVFKEIEPSFLNELKANLALFFLIIEALFIFIYFIIKFLFVYFKNKNPYISELNHSPIKSRTIRVFFVISFVLDITILGLIIGIPLFFILWAAEYIIFGSINPFYVFKKQELNND